MDTIDSKLRELAEQANEGHRQAVASFKKGTEHAEQAGMALIKAKSKLAHGQWGSWLAEHFEGSERTAQLYMRIAKKVRNPDEEIRNTVADLSLREAAEHFSERRVQTIRVKVTTEPLIPPRPAPRTICVVSPVVEAWPAQAPLVVEPPSPSEVLALPAPGRPPEPMPDQSSSGQVLALPAPERAPTPEADAPAPAVGDAALVASLEALLKRSGAVTPARAAAALAGSGVTAGDLERLIAWLTRAAQELRRKPSRVRIIG